MSTPDFAAQRAVLDRVGSLEREAAVLHAKQARAHAQMAALWGADPGVILELAGTSRIGQGRAAGRLLRDQRLVEHFPVALRLLELGVMRVGTVDIVLALSKNCPAPVQRLLDERLAERLCVMDAVDVRRLVASAILEIEAELDPDAQRHRQEQARADRGVWVLPVEDGMARIGAEVTQLDARRWALDFAELVRAQKVLDDRDGSKRTRAQREADVFLELPSRLLALADAASRGRLDRLLAQACSGTTEPAPLDTVPTPRAGAPDADVAELPLGLPPAPPPAWWQRDPEELVRELLRLPVRTPTTVTVHIPMTALLDLDQRSGWVEGLGAVPALQARMLVPVAALRRLAVDERTGVPIGIDPLRGLRPPWDSEYHPPPTHRRSAQAHRARLLSMLGPPMYTTDHAEPGHDPSRLLRELAQVRDQACDGPGCPRSAGSCELDHESAYAAGGQTALWNLRHRSPRCHHAKHDGWTVTHDPDTAVSSWLSPVGSSYQRRSLWQPSTPLPEQLLLPAPQALTPLELRPSRPDTDHDRPLWREPQPPTPRTRVRGIHPDDVDEHGLLRQPPVPPPTSTSWYDGPPPF